jgi:NAD(P)-dependent dehydrogenase (short-subunit alcohol dehydrogenase family)
VTGAASGIGRAIAARFSAEGAIRHRRGPGRRGAAHGQARRPGRTPLVIDLSDIENLPAAIESGGRRQWTSWSTTPGIQHVERLEQFRSQRSRRFCGSC